MVPVAHRVIENRRETHDCRTLTLEPAGERRLPTFAAGQFSMLYSFGVGEVPVSVSGGGRGEGPLEHTIRDVGAVTRALCRAEPGEVLGVRGPFGTAWPLEEAHGYDLVVVAGGVGLPPLRPVLLETIAHRERFARVLVAYGARTPADLLFGEDLAGWAADHDIDVRVTVDHATASWRGRVGVVPQLLAGAAFEPERTVAMIVGPEVMMRFTAAALAERGVRREMIWISMERSMKCAIGHCGHCQLGPAFVCKDGPVFRLDRIERLMEVRRL
jgi:NAD(P)H-flavin reductase